jgi:hypothetical protein
MAMFSVVSARLFVESCASALWPSPPCDADEIQCNSTGSWLLIVERQLCLSNAERRLPTTRIDRPSAKQPWQAKKGTILAGT